MPYTLTSTRPIVTPLSCPSRSVSKLDRGPVKVLAVSDFAACGVYTNMCRRAMRREEALMAESDQQQGQQQANPLQVLGRALTDIRKVQNLLELKYPDQGDAIKMQREAGDLIWHEIQRLQQSQQ